MLPLSFFIAESKKFCHGNVQQASERSGKSREHLSAAASKINKDWTANKSQVKGRFHDERGLKVSSVVSPTPPNSLCFVKEKLN